MGSVYRIWTVLKEAQHGNAFFQDGPCSNACPRYPCSRPVNMGCEHGYHLRHPCSRPVNTAVNTGSVYWLLVTHTTHRLCNKHCSLTSGTIYGVNIVMCTVVVPHVSK